MAATQDTSFARLVSLACHDLRTPLATVHGFARTLVAQNVGEPANRYLTIMGEATEQLAELLDDLALVARIEGGRWEPALEEIDSAELASRAAKRLGAERAAAGGEGATVRVDPEAVERALFAFGLAAVRHGGVERVQLRASGPELSIAPVTAEAAPIVLGDELRDLGAAVARRLIEAHGGAVSVAADSLHVSLPT